VSAPDAKTFNGLVTITVVVATNVADDVPQRRYGALLEPVFRVLRRTRFAFEILLALHLRVVEPEFATQFSKR
jgi:hypothetical protein